MGPMPLDDEGQLRPHARQRDAHTSLCEASMSFVVSWVRRAPRRWYVPENDVRRRRTLATRASSCQTLRTWQVRLTRTITRSLIAQHVPSFTWYLYSDTPSVFRRARRTSSWRRGYQTGYRSAKQHRYAPSVGTYRGEVTLSRQSKKLRKVTLQGPGPAENIRWETYNPG